MRKLWIGFLMTAICLAAMMPAQAMETANAGTEAAVPAGNVQEAADTDNVTGLQENDAAEPVEPAADEQAVTWYELTRDEMGADVLTVRFPSNPSTGFQWIFDISDPKMLELVTQEYIPDKNENAMDGVGGTWVASFRNFSSTAGSVTLALGYGRSWEDEPVELHVLEMQINEAGQIEITAVDPGEDLHDFYNPEGYDMIHITNVFTGDDGLTRIQGSFGSLAFGQDYSYSGFETGFLLTVMPECILMLPEDMDNPVENIEFDGKLEDWYSKARAAWAPEGSPLEFYAGFEMNEAAEITYLSYIYFP